MRYYIVYLLKVIDRMLLYVIVFSLIVLSSSWIIFVDSNCNRK
jgi:hypothetical protein